MARIVTSPGSDTRLSTLALYERIRADFPQALVQVRTLGNGDEVVVVSNGLFVWDIADWERLVGDPVLRKRL